MFLNAKRRPSRAQFNFSQRRGTTDGVEKSGSGLNCTDFGIFGIF